jgi:hypothetical protein
LLILLSEIQSAKNKVYATLMTFGASFQIIN